MMRNRLEEERSRLSKRKAILLVHRFSESAFLGTEIKRGVEGKPREREQLIMSGAFMLRELTVRDENNDKYCV